MKCATLKVCVSDTHMLQPRHCRHTVDEHGYVNPSESTGGADKGFHVPPNSKTENDLTVIPHIVKLTIIVSNPSL